MTRYEIARAEHRRWLLSNDKHEQEACIANHYTAFATLALELRRLIQLRDEVGPSASLDESIAFACDKIREGHLMEFGIPLEWPYATPQIDAYEAIAKAKGGQ